MRDKQAFVAIAAALSTAIVYIVTSEQPASIPATVVEIEAADLRLGEVASGRNYTRMVSLKNTTQEIIQIENVRASCTCTKVSPVALVIGSKEQGAVLLQFRPQAVPAQSDLTAIKPAITPFTIDLIAEVHSCKRVHPLQWTLAGEIRQDVFISPTDLYFQEHLDDEADKPRQEQVLTFKSCVPLKALQVTSNSEISASVRMETPTSGSVHVSLNHTSPGFVKSQITLTPLTLDNVALSDLEVSVVADIQSSFYALPDRLLLPPGRVGDEIKRVVVIQHPSADQADSQFIQAKAPVGTTVERVNLPEISGCAFSIAHRIAKLGTYTEMINFSAGNSAESINVVIQATGLNPDALE